ncbi:MAG: ATP-binding protein [Oceanicaulis sp.]
MAKLYSRKLLEIEVAVIKRMRQLGFPRDYIFSFISQPGRVISPAAVDEVHKGKIGPDVVVASDSTVRTFVLERLLAARLPQASGRIEAPISPWSVQQALLWAQRGDQSLFIGEGYDVELKILYNDESEYKYFKTMMAFANSYGGYILFGIEDTGRVCGFDHDNFLNKDWIQFGQRLGAHTNPAVEWEWDVVDAPSIPEFRFDSRLLLQLAKQRGIEKSKIDWLKDLAPKHDKRIGVIYVYPSLKPIVCRKTKKGQFVSGAYYFRDQERNNYTLDAETLPSGRPTRIQSNRESEFIKRIRELEFMLRLKGVASTSNDQLFDSPSLF